jgi:type VII secretion protein EccB
MQTRKDLYQAHRLMTQRVALALLQGRPSAVESPLRRTGVASLCGVMVVVLVAAGFGIAGLLLKGGARNLEHPGVLIIEKESGAAFAYSPQGHKLIPFVNYTSARLAMPTAEIQRKLVSSKSLAKYPRGPLTGIQGAPQSLPDGEATEGWSLCVRQNTVTLVGAKTVGGRPLTDAQSLIVQDGVQTWLIWRNTRMRITPKAARILTADPAVPVDGRWLNGLPQGPDFAPPPIPQQGRTFQGPDNTPVASGQIFHVAPIAGTPERWYVQVPDGLSNISTTQARLLLDAPGATPPRDLTPAAAASHPSQTNLHSRDLPETPPRIAPYDPQEPLCTIYRDTARLSTAANFTLGGTVPAATRGTADLDQVVMPGGGTFAGTLSGPGQPLQTFAILTDQGIRYPIPTSDDMTKLGYSPKKATPIPANLLRLFREGPALTTASARRPLPAM